MRNYKVKYHAQKDTSPSLKKIIPIFQCIENVIPPAPAMSTLHQKIEDQPAKTNDEEIRNKARNKAETAAQKRERFKKQRSFTSEL